VLLTLLPRKDTRFEPARRGSGQPEGPRHAGLRAWTSWPWRSAEGPEGRLKRPSSQSLLTFQGSVRRGVRRECPLIGRRTN